MPTVMPAVMSAVRILLLCLAAFAFSACNRPLTTSGTYLTDTQTQAIGVGTSLDALVELYGPPLLHLCC